MSDIFISYKREDQATARKLADALEVEGWTVWWDPKVRAGERFNDVIEKALKESKCAVVMWSERSVESQYVKHEANYALKRNKLVPLMIEEVELPFRFEDLHTPSLLDWDGSKDASEFRRLVEDITAIIGPPLSEAKRKADEEKKKNLAPQEAQMQRRAKKLIRHRSGKKSKRMPDKPRELSLFLDDKLKNGSQGPKMIVIPPGTFWMGDIKGDGKQSELPVHAVRINRPFAIGRYEVTFEEYANFAAETLRELPSDEHWGRGRRPVINVSWNDAVGYAGWLSSQTGKAYRLPSEAEWEYAATSGGREGDWAGASRKEQLGEYAWYQANSGGETHPVGNRKPNVIGVHDMTGNVWEWVEDEWHDNYQGAPTDGGVWSKVKGATHRVIRGGSWSDGPESLRISTRIGSSAGLRHYGIGFRLARDLD